MEGREKKAFCAIPKHTYLKKGGKTQACPPPKERKKKGGHLKVYRKKVVAQLGGGGKNARFDGESKKRLLAQVESPRF